jgi:hypothetical protein
MDFYAKLPAPARIGIPIVALLVILFVVYSTMMKAPKPVTVVHTQDYGVFEAAQAALRSSGIDFHPTATGNDTFDVTVLPESQTDANTALAKSGIKDLTGTIKKVSCPAPPGFTGTAAANKRADNCADEKAIQNMLLTAGASAANVKVSQKDNDTLIGPETSKSVLGQVFLEPSMQGKWRADEAARAIATAIGTSVDNVTLTDGKLQTLFSGSDKTAVGGIGGSAATGTGAGCSDMATATEIATKEAAVSSCYNDRIAADLKKLLGGTDRFVLTVNARVDAKSRSSEYTRNKYGAVTAKTTDKGDGRTMEDVDNEPNTMSGGEVKPAGDIAMLSLAVTLDSNFVDDRQELAVKRLLSTYIVPSRKDPAPKVTRIAFSKGAGGAAADNDDQLTSIREDARTGTTEPNTITKTKKQMPMGLLVMMGIVVAALLIAMIALWQRSEKAAKDRARYEEEFRNEQRVLDGFAQTDPARYAAELEQMLGMPVAAPERAY